MKRITDTTPRAKHRSVPILTYHLLSPDRMGPLRRYTVTPRAFEKQLALLAHIGCCTVTMDDVLEALAGRASLPPRAVVITFDDAYADAVRRAVPVLVSHKFSATFYVVAGLVGSTSRWLRTELGVEARLADAAALRELESAGSRCESHTLTHPRLAGLAAEPLRRELTDSRSRLEDLLGRAVRHLAYPFGSVDATARAAAADAGYATAVTTAIGRASARDDRLALPRLNVSGRDTLLDFLVRLRAGRSARELILDTARAKLRRRK
jgi:peptidoglycan/xylan/chitin deacetylase (PgdA/CDA1 family)